MKITALGCTHGAYKDLKLDGGDLLILTGDYTARDKISEWCEFFIWLSRQPYKKKILIGGNHDNFLTECIPTEEARQLLGMGADDFEYLCDTGTEFQYENQIPHPASNEHVSIDILFYEVKTLKIWGMPHSLTFEGINPHCKAFTGDEAYMKQKCDLIPDDIDILVTHSPPWGLLDHIEIMDGSLFYTGSQELLKAVDRVKPKILLCSHIHENGGQMLMYKSNMENPSWHIDCYNVSIMNENYKPVNKPLYLEI